MVKAKDFWDYLCNGLNYRFFAGVPCNGLSYLYNNMDSGFMHYIPAVNEDVAVGLVNGANVAGINSSVLMDANRIEKLNLDFNLENSLPLLIIASSSEKPSFKKEIYNVTLTDDYKADLEKITKHSLSKGKPCVLFIGEEMIQ